MRRKCLLLGLALVGLVGCRRPASPPEPQKRIAVGELGSSLPEFSVKDLQGRYVYAEDIEATIYSALGIDWTSVRHDDPLGRGFEYVPSTGPIQFAPVNELFA